jgi:hypothetical protein
MEARSEKSRFLFGAAETAVAPQKSRSPRFNVAAGFLVMVTPGRNSVLYGIKARMGT